MSGKGGTAPLRDNLVGQTFLTVSSYRVKNVNIYHGGPLQDSEGLVSLWWRHLSGSSLLPGPDLCAPQEICVWAGEESQEGSS